VQDSEGYCGIFRRAAIRLKDQVLRLRPIMMTMLAAMLGLLPTLICLDQYAWIAGERDVLPVAEEDFEEGEPVD
jgi:hypothetical protein